MIERATHRAPASGTPTVLFLDEIHRFNKAQQDALLPAVEDGLVTLIGATTENPAFEVNGALLSRVRVYALAALTPQEVRDVLRTRRRSGDRERRGGEALEFLAARCEGDARTALNALELAVETAARARRGAAWASRASRTRCSAARCSTTSGRPPLRLHLGLDQGDARLRPRRLALLPRGDARGRRGPALHRATDGDPRLRGHRQRRPGGAVGGDRGRRRGRARRPARGALRARPGGDLPRRSRRSPTPPDRALGGRERHVREHGAAPVPAWLRSGPLRRRLRTPARLREPPRPARPRRRRRSSLPAAVQGERFYEPDEAEAELAERLEAIRRGAGAPGAIIATRWTAASARCSPRGA